MKIENIDIGCNSAKMQYSKLNEFFASKNLINNPQNKYVYLIDISYMISIIERIANISPDSGFTDTDLDDKTITALVYGILNVAGHYRHHSSTSLKCASVLIMYASNGSHYVKYQKTFALIGRLLNLFRKTIFVERLEDETKFIYQNVAYFTAMNIFSLNSESKRTNRIVYIGNNTMMFQLLRIDPEMINIKHGHITGGTDVFFNSDYLKVEKDDVFISSRNVGLISSMLSLLGFHNGFPRLESLKRKQSSIVYSKIFENCREIVDKDNFESIVEGFGLSDSDVQLFGIRLKQVDPDFQNKTFSLGKTLLKIWSSKLHTNAIHSYNDFSKYDDLTLNTFWLMGN